MQNFIYHVPTKVVFGKDAECQTAEEVKALGGSRVLIVYGGGSVVKSGLLNKITAEFEAEGVAFELLGGVKPNPRLEFAREGIQKALQFKADFILAVGGGSVIDTCKGIAHGAANPETDIWEFWTGEKQLTRSMPVGVVLTISAAGSETSNSAVLTNEATGVKRGLSTEFNRPKFAIMNPELTYTLPAFQISCGIVDIMMHTLDRYFTHTKGNEMTDEIAEALLRTTIKNGAIAMKNHRDYEAMSELMWCGSLSHNTITGLGAETDFGVHQLGHELSGKFDVAHGASLSVMWGAWAKYVYMEEPERFKRYAQKVWHIEENNPVEAAKMSIEATVNYFKSLGMPTTFQELGIGIQDENTLKDLTVRCLHYGKRTIGKFKVLGEKDVYEIYKSVNE